MAALRTPILACLLVLALAVPVHAGTAAAPEVKDPANDEAVGGVVPIAQQPPAGTTVGLNVDLLAGWVTETADTLVFTIQIQGSGNPTSSSTTTWTFHFETGGHPFDASATEDMASAQSGVPGTGQIKPGGVATTATAAGDHLIVLGVPKLVASVVPGSVLTNLSVSATGKTAGQASSVTDRAPNSGAGTDYVVTGGGAAKTTYGVLAGANVTVAQAFVNATSANYVYNWTQAPANATVRLQVHGTGNVTVAVRDAANATLLRESPRNQTVWLNVTGKAGRWTVALNYTAFKGNLTLAILPRAAVMPLPATGSTTPSQTGSHPPTGGSTGTGSPGGSGGSASSTSTSKTPFPGAALLLAGLGLAALARRRRA